MDTPRFYSPDVSSIHTELGNLDHNNGTIDIDEGLLLGGIGGHFAWGFDSQLDDLSYLSNQAKLASRSTKKRKLQTPNDHTTGSTSQSHVFAAPPPHITPQPKPTFYDLTTPPPKGNELLLSQIVEIFPDISHSYVEGLISRRRAEGLQGGREHFDFVTKDLIVEDILENPSYPKQGRLKRKAEDVDNSGWTPDVPYQGNSLSYTHVAVQVLAKEFPTVPMQYIREVICDTKRLYKAYLAIFAQINLPRGTTKRFEELKSKRTSAEPNLASRSDPAFPFMDDLGRELKAAKRKCEKEIATRRKQKEEEEAEKRNEDEHKRTGNMMECQCCYLDVPLNRSIPCEGTNVHFFCYTCIRKSAESQLGLMRYRLQCFDVSGCEAKFPHQQLREALGPILMDKLDSLQQLDEIQNARLDGLEDCPFCLFKAVCPPVEEDREFRCRNPECEVVSCRLCREKSHIPLTCQEARKEKGISERHIVEEAMSKALIRNCPNCNVNIIKEFGCNKMTCSKCHCIMCYICKKDITREKYKHFGRGPNSCAQDDYSMEDRYKKEVQEAEKVAISRILAENPGLTEEELRIQLPTAGPKKSKLPLPPPMTNNFVFPRMGDARPGQPRHLYPPAPPPYDQGLQAQYAGHQGVNGNVPGPRNGAIPQPFPDPQSYNRSGVHLPFDLNGLTNGVTIQDNAFPTAPQNYLAANIPQIQFTPPAQPFQPFQSFLGAYPAHMNPYVQAPIPQQPYQPMQFEHLYRGGQI